MRISADVGRGHQQIKGLPVVLPPPRTWGWDCKEVVDAMTIGPVVAVTVVVYSEGTS
jgi:hypothetical protein